MQLEMFFPLLGFCNGRDLKRRVRPAGLTFPPHGAIEEGGGVQDGLGVQTVVPFVSMNLFV